MKLGLVIGGGIESATFFGAVEQGGWEFCLTTAETQWRVWFNPRADGRETHQNTIARWRGLETDAFALVLKKHAGREMLAAVEASFLRRDGAVLAANLRRQPLLPAVSGEI